MAKSTMGPSSRHDFADLRRRFAALNEPATAATAANNQAEEYMLAYSQTQHHATTQPHTTHVSPPLPHNHLAASASAAALASLTLGKPVLPLVDDDDASTTVTATAARSRGGARHHHDHVTPDELEKLDAQIVELRKKHDKLHDANNRKRGELDALVDKLKIIQSSTAPNESASMVRKLKEAEKRLEGCARRYEEEHRRRRTYEQIINRMREERLRFPEERKRLEALVKSKEAEYEQLLLMSYDANQAREKAKHEFNKFEMLAQEERRQRDKELLARRQQLQKKQQEALEFERSEKERHHALEKQSRSAGTVGQEELDEVRKLLEAEQRKIATYEAAFGKIKEATGVADVNEVIQKFLSQEETHQNLLGMTKESTRKLDGLREAVSVERAAVERLKTSLSERKDLEAGRRLQRDPQEPTRDVSAEARQQLNRAHARWRTLQRTKVTCKAAVQHLVDLLEPLKLDDEFVSPLTDDTLLEHLAQGEKKIRMICSAFLDEYERNADLLDGLQPAGTPHDKTPQKKPGDAAATTPAAAPPAAAPAGGAKEASDEEDTFEEGIEDDVPDREALKRASVTLAERRRAKKNRRKTRLSATDDDGGAAARAASKAMAPSKRVSGAASAEQAALA